MSDEQQTSPTSDLKNVAGGSQIGKDRTIAEQIGFRETGADPAPLKVDVPQFDVVEGGPYGPDSERALEAFASIPGDSEHTADYGQKSEVIEGRDPLVRQVLDLPPAELREYYDLSVEVVVSLPDGTTFTYREQVEKDAPDDYDLDEAVVMLDVSSETMIRRLTRRSSV